MESDRRNISMRGTSVRRACKSYDPREPEREQWAAESRLRKATEKKVRLEECKKFSVGEKVIVSMGSHKVQVKLVRIDLKEGYLWVRLPTRKEQSYVPSAVTRLED